MIGKMNGGTADAVKQWDSLRGPGPLTFVEQGQTEVAPRSEIDSALSDLHQSLAFVEVAISKLVERLRPVLVPAPSSVGKNDATCTYGSAVGQEIGQATDKARAAAAAVHEIMASLAI